MQTAPGIEHGPADSRNIGSVLEWADTCLAQRGIDEARLNAELLLARVIGCPRLHVGLQRDRVLTAEEAGRFSRMLSRRLAHEPLQYILGEAEFMGLTLTVDHRVLIPRPETELLVERALDVLKLPGRKGVRILDIGAGSGNVAIALGRRAPSAEIVAVDASPAALQVAAQNVARHGTRNVRLLEADIFADLLPGERFHVIVSNPPYVSLEEFETLQPEVRDFEPKQATTDGGDGLRFVRRIASFAAEHLVDRGTLLMEIGYTQSLAAREALTSAGLIDITLADDVAGIPRVIAGRRAPSDEGGE
jgi:release factor glutamine methyltransferase